MKELKLTHHSDSIKEEVIKNIRFSHTLDLPLITEFIPAHDRVISICGSGPSLSESINDIEGDIWAINGTHDWLLNHEICPKAAFFFDASPVMIQHIKKPMKGIIYYLASHCHRTVFDALHGHDIRLFHADIGHEIISEIERLKWYGPVFHGGCAGATRAPFIAYGLGYREIHIHGADSSFDNNTHIDRNESGNIIDVNCYGETFFCHPWMAIQAKEIINLPYILKGANIIVHGRGLLPHIAKVHGMHYNQRIC